MPRTFPRTSLKLTLACLVAIGLGGFAQTPSAHAASFALTTQSGDWNGPNVWQQFFPDNTFAAPDPDDHGSITYDITLQATKTGDAKYFSLSKNLNINGTLTIHGVNSSGNGIHFNSGGRLHLNSGGVLDLSGANILVNSSGNTDKFFFNGGTLKDVGTFKSMRLKQDAGTLQIGGSIGKMAMEKGYTLGNGDPANTIDSFLEIEIDGTAGAGNPDGHDQVNVTGSAVVNSDGQIRLLLGDALDYEQLVEDGSSFDILTSTSTLDADWLTSFETLEFEDETGTLTFEASIDGNNTLRLTAADFQTVVPEPASVAIWSLIGLGLAGFGIYRRRRAK